MDRSVDGLPFDEGYLIGLLIGDGEIVTKDNELRFRLYTTNSIYLRWIVGKFAEFVDRIEESTYKYDGERRDSYEIFSKPHPRLRYFADFYYQDEIYPIPDDKKLTPEALKMWHVSDGTLNWPYGARNPTLHLATDTKHSAEERYYNLFKELGVELKSSNKSFYFSVSDTHELIKYMRYAVPGFEYKWECSSEEQYRKVKNHSG